MADPLNLDVARSSQLGGERCGAKVSPVHIERINPATENHSEKPGASIVCNVCAKILSSQQLKIWDRQNEQAAWTEHSKPLLQHGHRLLGSHMLQRVRRIDTRDGIVWEAKQIIHIAQHVRMACQILGINVDPIYLRQLPMCSANVDKNL